ncbi:hypothetical protein BVX98_06430 [bacterium F11]|nr:hypothetical protein BVX98_06430 [bacterium F11]
MKIKLSVLQTSPLFLNSNANRKKMESEITKAKGEILVFPELCTSGYNFRTKREVQKVAEPAFSGPTSLLLFRLAQKKNCVIVAGFPEVHRDRYFNSALIVTPKKQEVYRKVHLFWKEKLFFSPGMIRPSLYAWKGLRFGVMICFDWFFPEMARSLSLGGAQVLIHPSNLVLPYAPLGMRVRSLENHVYSATANRVGSEKGLKYIGQSQITGPKGNILGKLDGIKTGTLTVTIDVNLANQKNITPLNHIFKDRKPKLYF